MSPDLSFEQVVQDHQAMVFRTLYRLTGSREHLEDLAQEVFLRAVSRAAELSRRIVSEHLSLPHHGQRGSERVEAAQANGSAFVSISEERAAGRIVCSIRSGTPSSRWRSGSSGCGWKRNLQELSGVERTVLVLYHQEERSGERDRGGAGDADRNDPDPSASRTEEASRAFAARCRAGEERLMFDDSMNPEAEAEREFDARIAEQLERLPDLSAAIPADFAARVAAKVPVRRRPVSVRTTHYGRTLMVLGLVVLFVALVVLAKHSFTTSPIGMALEWTLCIQFLAFAVWMGRAALPVELAAFFCAAGPCPERAGGRGSRGPALGGMLPRADDPRGRGQGGRRGWRASRLLCRCG